jgi:hypothetical protein
MSEELFYLIAYSTFGLSTIPFIFSVIFFVKSRSFSKILFSISLLELITGTSNISLSIFGYGHLTGQFTVYFLLEIFTWLFLLYTYYLTLNQVIVLSLSTLIAVTLICSLGSSSTLIFVSKLLQFILGFMMLWKHSYAKNKTRESGNLLYLAVGLMLYAFMVIHLFFFWDVLVKMNLEMFNLTWFVHQFAAIIYFSLLSISTWKSRKI